MNVTKQEFAGVKILVKALLHTAIVFKLTAKNVTDNIDIV